MIRADVRKRAQGVFLWVVLVVKRLNQELDRGNVRSLQSRLDEVPDGLKNLFRDTLSITDEDDGGMLKQMMQWMVYAQGTLTREELYFGVHTGSLLTGSPRPWNRDEITPEVMDHFIVNCSRGLIESTGQKYPKMQFIHESVRDYMFGGGLELIAPENGKNLTGASHDHIKRSCLKLLTSSTLSYVSNPDRLLNSEHEQEHSDAGHALRTQFPLLSYAFTHIIHHAEFASEHGDDQSEFVSSFPLQIWNRVSVLMGRTPAISKTEVFIANGGHELLRYELHAGYPILTPTEHVVAIRNATRYGDHKILELVLKRGVVVNLCDHDQTLVFEFAINFQDQRALEIFFDSGMRFHKGHCFELLLLKALLKRDCAVVQVLIDHEAHFGPSIKNYFDYSHAVDQDIEIVADLTCFHYAALAGREDIVKRLLEPDTIFPGARQFFRWNDGSIKPMYLAALMGHHAIVVQILKHPSWREAPDCAVWHDSLHVAAMNGHNETVRVLLADGTVAQTRTVPLYYEEVVESTAWRGRGGTLKILLDAPHFRAQSQEIFGRALASATRRGHRECVKILEDRGIRLPGTAGRSNPKV